MVVLLMHGDVTAMAVSMASYRKIEAYTKRMGWSFDWYSSSETDFNRDYGVSFTREEVASKAPTYNYGSAASFATESPGISVFIKDDSGKGFNTYSTYGRALDMLNLTDPHLALFPQ